MKFKRIFMINFEGLGVGEAIDSESFNCKSCNTLNHLIEKENLFIPNLEKLGLIKTLTMENKESDAYYTIARPKLESTSQIVGKMELLAGEYNNEYKKDTQEPFKRPLLEKIAVKLNIPIIGNIIADDNQIINQLIQRHIETHALIIYTTGDSNMIIASLDKIFDETKLQEYAETIINLLPKDELVSEIITKTISKDDNYYIKETHHFIPGNHNTILDTISENNYQTIGIGKINEIIKTGINKKINAKTNNEAINKLIDLMDKNFNGLTIIDLDEFSKYAHERNSEKSKQILEEFDVMVPIILNKLNIDDLLIITSTSSCDPTFAKVNNTRENLPVIIYSRIFNSPHQLDIMDTMSSIGATILDILELPLPWDGISYKEKLK